MFIIDKLNKQSFQQTELMNICDQVSDQSYTQCYHCEKRTFEIYLLHWLINAATILLNPFKINNT